MSYILKTNPIPVNIKLTNAGREKLSQGNFNVTHFSLGDTEMNYKFYKNNSINQNLSNVLLPFENLTDIRYKLKKSFNDTEFLYPVTPFSTKNIVYNDVNMGFFDENNNNFSFNTEIDRVKESNIKIDISQLSSDTNIVNIVQDSNYLAGSGVEIGDYILISWINPYMVSGDTENQIKSEVYSLYLFYKIIGLSGTIGGNNLQLTLDRNLPNFGAGVPSGTFYSKCFIYPKYDSIIDYYGTEFLSDYWGFTDDNYIENCYNPNNRVKIWNYTLFYPENYIAIKDTDKIPNDLYSFKFKSFLNYISANNIDNVYGIVHYTNSLPDNNIGEGFYENSAQLVLPTIMWHKNKENKIGVVFSCEQNINIIQESNIRYYNLVDPNNFIVGKCFPDLKIFLIEDQELVKILAFKTNRNWTLPNTRIGISGLNC